MSGSAGKVSAFINNLLLKEDEENIIKNISQKNADDVKDIPGIPSENPYTKEGYRARTDFLEKENKHAFDYIKGEKKFEDYSSLKGNIENFVGMAQVPIGLAGPLLINGTHARGDYYVPLATTEGALVASYQRGIKASRLSGGITSVCTGEGVQRCPVFCFNNIGEAGQFVIKVLEHIEEIKKIPAQCSSYAKLTDVRPNMEGNHVILTFDFTTGDAAGQNMVTLCTDQICRYLAENMPVKPLTWYIESNYSGDKKATANSFINVRGKKVIAEVALPRKIVQDILKTTPELITEYSRIATFGIMQSGAIGAQGHYANGLAAVFIACGQDAACVAEASVGITRMEVLPSGDLYAAVTLPNLIVGTVGGGTSLPTQKECLQIMDCYGADNAVKFAEVCAGLVLAGELSITAALSAGHFTSAHKKLGRKN